MEHKQGSHNARDSNRRENKQIPAKTLWSITRTAIAIQIYLIGVFFLWLLIPDYVQSADAAKVFIESIFSLAIVIVIVVHAIMYYKQAKETNRQAEIAVKQFEITDRPWLKFTAVFSQGITFNEGGGLQTQFTYKAKNVGRSVAINATINTRIVIPEWSTKGVHLFDQVLNQQAAICEEIAPNLLSYSIFPDDDYTVNFGWGLIRDDVK